MVYTNKKVSEYVKNIWDSDISLELKSIKSSLKREIVIHVCLHIILFALVFYGFKHFTMPHLEAPDDPYFYILTIIPNLILGYFSKNIFLGLKRKIKSLYNKVLNNFNIAPCENDFIKLRDIKSNISGIFDTAYIEDTFEGKYNDIPFELAIVKMEKLSYTTKNKFYRKITGTVLVLNDFWELNKTAVISRNLNVKTLSSDDEQKIKNFLNSEYFENISNMMNLNGILFKDGKIFIFLRQPNRFGLSQKINKINFENYNEFFSIFFNNISIIDELNIAEKFEQNSCRALVRSEKSKFRLFSKALKAVLLYLLFLMITFYIVTILTITIMLSLTNEYLSIFRLAVSLIISVIIAYFLTLNYRKQLFSDNKI